MNDKLHWNPQPKVYRSGPYTVEAPGYQKVDGETVPRRNARSPNELHKTPEEGIDTIFDIVKRGARKFGNANAVGSRKVVKVHEEVKKMKKKVDGKDVETEKKWTYSELSGYKYKSFIEYEAFVLQLGSGLRKLGLEPSDRLHLFAATSPSWLGMAHGASSQSIPIVTAYDTLGEEGLRHSLVQTKAKAIYLDSVLLPKLVKPLNDAKNIKHIIYNDDSPAKQEHIDKLKSEHSEVTIHSVSELRQLGESNPTDPVLPKADDLCCIMYTSGSTGPPKGVLITHRNVLAAVAGVTYIYGQYLGPGDGLLAYLPLAHILEFVFENAVLFWGATLGYGNPRTLTDASVRNSKGDIAEFAPSALVGVPQVWETVKKGVITKVNASGFVIKNMFWGAMAAKSFLLSYGLPGAGVLDAVVFSKIRQATGGRLRICLNGGGPIAKETQRFISLAITPMLSGYGLTETVGMGAVMDPDAWIENSLGEVPVSVEVKLVDYAEAGYHSTNNPPQGEIWIRGPAVTTGYLDLEKESKEAYTSDGWFKTGDVGEFDSRGYLTIIDRKKNLVKTLNGEYIALEKLESTYRQSTVVGNICVYAASDKSKPIAIIVPAEPALKKLAGANGIKGDSLEELCGDSKLNKLVLKDLQSTGKSAGLSGIEIIDGCVLADEEWTPQNGLTTSSAKLNRKGILEKYKKQIAVAYGDE